MTTETKKTDDSWEADTDAAHKLYKSKGGEYGFTGPFYCPGPKRAIDDDLWSKCIEAVTK